MIAGLGRLAQRAFTGPGAKETLKAALPGAGLNLALGTLTGGPVEGLAYAAGDLLVNYPALRAARKFSPGKQQQIKDLATGKITQSYAPSMVENVTNIGASIGSGALVSNLLTPKQQQQTEAAAQEFLAQQAQQVNPALQSQPQQLDQQILQRSVVNQLPLNQQNLSPNTMYQMQGLEHTEFHYPGVTLPPELLEMIR
jgi:hypothetical protein